MFNHLQGQNSSHSHSVCHSPTTCYWCTPEFAFCQLTTTGGLGHHDLNIQLLAYFSFKSWTYYATKIYCFSVPGRTYLQIYDFETSSRHWSDKLQEQKLMSPTWVLAGRSTCCYCVMREYESRNIKHNKKALFRKNPVNFSVTVW